MTLSDLIAFQRAINPEINEVWLPADVVLETIAKAESAELDRLARALLTANEGEARV